MIGWVIGSYLYLNRKPTETGYVVVENTITNLFPSPNDTQQNPHKFKIKSKYERGDIVFIKFFHIQAAVITEVTTDTYMVLYRDANHVLQQTTLHREFLLSPPDGIWNTFPIDN
jgi:hypothetical protein